MRFPIRQFCISLFAAVAAANAEAVHISANGTGQVLLFPYYTVRNGFATILSVINTQNNTKIVKVRFLEGMNGREVSSFNLFLAPNDTWTTAVVETANGARIITNDNSCVTPSDLFTETRRLSGGQLLNEFFNFQYTGGRQDNPAFSSLDRTREGYLEIIEMGVIDPTLSTTAAQIVGYAKPRNFNSNTYNCAALDSFDSLSNSPRGILFPNTSAAMMVPPRGGLKGRASLINAANGANYSFAPTTLDGWSSQIAYSPAGDASGTLLRDAFPATSMVTTTVGIVTSRWANGRDAVSAVLMRESLINEYVLDTGTVSQTDWVATFPTKPFYTDPLVVVANTGTRAPFSGTFSSTGTTGCDEYSPAQADRDGFANVQGIIFPSVARPPLPVGAVQTSELCRTANVVPFLAAGTEQGFGQSSLLSTATPSQLGFYSYVYIASSTIKPSTTTTPSLSAIQGPNGLQSMLFNGAQQQLEPLLATLTSPSGAQAIIHGTHFGLPMIGFMLHNYKNANVASRYGGVVEHAYSVRVE